MNGQPMNLVVLALIALGCWFLWWWNTSQAPRMLNWMARVGWVEPPSNVPASCGGAPSHRDFLVIGSVFLLPWAALAAGILALAV